MTHRVVVATTLSEAGLSLLRGEVGGLAQVIAPEQAAQHTALASAEAILIRDEISIDEALLSRAPSLKVIGRAGVGIAGIDVETATRRGIIVMNTPGINAISAAEYTFALMLGLARHMIEAHNRLSSGQWKRDALSGMQLAGKTLGIIGLGRVGTAVAKRAIAFGMKVQVYDPYVNESQIQGMQVKLVGLDVLLANADIVSLHCAATPETRHLINLEALTQMKHGALLINTAHGSIVDEQALLSVLDSGRLGGAALDVFAREPHPENRLLNHPKVLHTPHLGDSTVEAQHDLGVMIVQQVLDALRGVDYRNVVNMPVIDGQPFPVMLPYLRLAEGIGRLHYHMADGDIRRVLVELKGEEFRDLVKPMTVALLKGLLTPILGDQVNYVNAPILAHDRGIYTNQVKGLDSTDYKNLLSCQVQSLHSEMVVAGALFNHTDPHVVQIDEYRTDFPLEGTILIIGSYDIPGVIGRVGLFLAENNINIADWRTGRAERGGQTLSMATLDEPLPDEILEALRAQDYIRHARQIQL